MVIELLFLLLPVAAASGWWVGRRSAKRKTPGSQRLSSDYFRGLHYLLNEQTDQAIEVFIRMLEVDSDTVEIHLALGSLFRRRGEVDRAIRIHQNLIARPLLSPEHRSQALYELGEDYMRAGLLDRAEALFSELGESREYSARALYRLADIYQQEKDWNKAVAVARKLEGVGGEPMGAVIAQYYCELAELAVRQHDKAQALKLIKQALTVDRDCVRASLLEGELQCAAGNLPAAIEAYRRVEKQDAAFLPEVVDPLVECHRQLGKTAEMIEYLEAMVQRYGGISLVLSLAELLREQHGDRYAANMIVEQLKRRPSIRGLERVIGLTLVNTQGVVHEELKILKDLMEKLVLEKPIYRCGNCGFTSKGLYWQCPGCRYWGTVRPIQGVEGE